MAKYIILLDMDNTTFDFDGGMAYHLPRVHSEIELQPRANWLVQDDYPEEIAPIVRGVWANPEVDGFFENLSPLPGAIEAVEEMLQMGWEVQFCSFLIADRPHIEKEKRACLARYFDSRVEYISAEDKTQVDGHILVDDCPRITGVRIPSWKQVYYTQVFNEHLPGPRINDWFNWKPVILPLLDGV